MKHRVYGKHLGRNKDQRERLFKSLIRSLFLHGTIETSQEKAKAVKGLVDKVINLSKDKSRSGLLQAYVSDKSLQDRLTAEIGPKTGSRTSGYTSLIKLGQRLGDNTMMVRMSIIGQEEMKPLEKKVPQVERVPQVSRVEKTVKKTSTRGTRDTSKSRGTSKKTIRKVK